MDKMIAKLFVHPAGISRVEPLTYLLLVSSDRAADRSCIFQGPGLPGVSAV